MDLDMEQMERQYDLSHVVSVWAAGADGSGVYQIFSSDDYGFEDVIGWISNRLFMTSTWQRGCEFSNLRIINAENGQMRSLWRGNYGDLAFDPQSKAILLSVPGFLSDYGCDLNYDQGLYLHSTMENAVPLRIVEDDIVSLMWSPEANLFFAKTDSGILAVSSTGDFIDLHRPESADGFPLVAPVTQQLAWTGNELWIGSLLDSLDTPPTRIYDQPVYEAIWGPKGEFLHFISEGSYFVAQSPDFVPMLVKEDLIGRGFTWVRP